MTVRRFLAVVALVFAMVLPMLWLTLPYVAEWLRPVLEERLSGVVKATVRVDQIDLTLFPLALELRKFAVTPDSPALLIDEVRVTVSLAESLRHMRPWAHLRARGVFVDVGRIVEVNDLTPSTPPNDLPVGPFELVVDALSDVVVQFPVADAKVRVVAPVVSGRIGSTIERPRLGLGLVASEVRMERGPYVVPLRDLRADGIIRLEELYLDTFHVAGDALRLTIEGAAEPPATAHRFDGELPVPALAVLLDAFTTVEALGTLNGTLRGELFDPEVDADLGLQTATFGGVPFGSLRARFIRRGRELSAHDATWTAWGGHGAGAVDLHVDETSSLKGHAKFSEIDLLSVGRQSPPEGAPIRSSGRIDVSGQLTPLGLIVTGDGSVDLSAEAVGGVPGDVQAMVPGGWTARVAIGDGRLALTGGARLGVGTHADIDASVTGDQIDGHLRVGAGDLRDVGPLLPSAWRTGLAGHLRGEVSVSGTLRKPIVAASVDGRGIVIADVPIAQARGDVTWDGERLAVNSLDLSIAKGSVRGSGAIAVAETANNEGQLVLDRLNLAALRTLVAPVVPGVPEMAGTISGRARAGGPWARLKAEGDLTAHALLVAGEWFTELSASASAELPSWQGRAQLTRSATERLSLTGEGSGLAQVRLAVDSSAWDLGSFAVLKAAALDGSVRLHGEVTGAIDSLGGALQLEAAGLVAHGFELGDLTVKADGSSGKWTVTADAFDDALHLVGDLVATAEWPFNLSGQWRSSEIRAHRSKDDIASIESQGRIDLRGALTALSKVSGGVEATQLSVTGLDYDVKTTEPIVIRLGDGRMELVRLVMAGQHLQLRAAGSVSTAGTVALSVNAQGTMAVLDLVGDAIQSATGEFTLAAEILREPVTGWRLDGSSQLNDVAVDFGLPFSLTGTNATLSLEGSRITIASLDGDAGGGTFSVSGGVDVERGPDLLWTIDEISPGTPQWLDSRLSGTGRLSGRWKALLLSGDITIDSAVYDQRLRLIELIPWFRRQVPPVRTRPDAEVPLTVDLHVHAPDGLFIDNNFAKLELAADLRVAGPLAGPSVLGRVHALDGTVKIQQRTFRIINGVLEFRDRDTINPSIDIAAESEVRSAEGSYTITVTVTGTLDDYRVTFGSDDSRLSQKDIVSLITVGKTSTQAQQEGGAGVSLGDVAAFGPSIMSSALEEDAQSWFGIDRFEVDSVYDSATGRIDPRLTIGKDLTDKLQALVTTSLGVTTQQSVVLDYHLTRRVSLQGSWEAQADSAAGAFGAGVKVRYEFRKLPQFSLFNGQSPHVAP